MADSTTPDDGAARAAGYDPRWILWSSTKRVQTYEHIYPDGWVRVILWAGGGSPEGQRWTTILPEFATRSYGVYMRKGEVLKVTLGGRAVWPSGDRGDMDDWTDGKLIQGGYPDGGNGLPSPAALSIQDGNLWFSNEIAPGESQTGAVSVLVPWPWRCNGGGGSTSVELVGKGRIIIEPGDSALRSDPETDHTSWGGFGETTWDPPEIGDLPDPPSVSGTTGDSAPTFSSATYEPDPPPSDAAPRAPVPADWLDSWGSGLVASDDVGGGKTLEQWRSVAKAQAGGGAWRGADASLLGSGVPTTAGGGGYGGGAAGPSLLATGYLRGWFGEFEEWITPEYAVVGVAARANGTAGGRWYSTAIRGEVDGTPPVTVYDPLAEPVDGDLAWPDSTGFYTGYSIPSPYVGDSRVGFGAAWICPLDIHPRPLGGWHVGRIGWINPW